MQRKCLILCVDDHEDTSEMLKLLLSHEDAEVVTAVAMAQALELAQSQNFDLYVLDKHLPDGSGIELCRKLVEVTPNVPCMFYTGDAYEVHRQQCLAAGADDYVAKPDIDGLIVSVRNLLSRRDCAAKV
jgi:DNA-binding response OmpR family regulator